MRFSASRVAFGRHESFHLRFCWLSKGFTELQRDLTLVTDVDRATLALGVGKNMVVSIRYWLRAARMIRESDSSATKLGDFLLHPSQGEDPFLEDEGTLWLLHWLIASNTETATTIAWFFNKFHKPRFGQQELRAALGAYLQSSVESYRRPAASTLRTDVSVLTRTYARHQSAGSIEELMDSPLAELELITETGKNSYQSLFGERPSLPCEIVGFALLQLLECRGVQVLPLDDILQSTDGYVSPGTIFRLTEAGLMSKLEELVNAYPRIFDLRESAGLRHLFLRRELPAIDLLKTYYQQASSMTPEVAA
ncbi:MAG: DUF4007 family protein [Gammaproteobacteria bacterium]|nr:DUF4007 family protein [Gammaproteobacteria bacterium]MYA66942.1 DUF4007 family protein [Gammaproteobacteria bacterium]MYG96720.1 DUF4007 family protein [Gammaproteobacteria bacterium]MYH46572.1 DUF4007 family protein [Gammaproteobacteria bacterium]MYL13686.1 DUF4007 family protein [Gammaproteobacteria bacterium]